MRPMLVGAFPVVLRGNIRVTVPRFLIPAGGKLGLTSPPDGPDGARSENTFNDSGGYGPNGSIVMRPSLGKAGGASSILAMTTIFH